MDTGVLHSSYISRDLVDKHREAWRGKVLYVWYYKLLISSLLQPQLISACELCPGRVDTKTARRFRLFSGSGGDRAGNSIRERQTNAEADLVLYGFVQSRTVEGVETLGSILSDFPVVSPWP